MTWPQWVVALWLSLGFIGGIRRGVDYLKKKSQDSSGTIAFFVVLELVSTTAMVFVLHSGGFW